MSLLYGEMPDPIIRTYETSEPRPSFYSVGVDLGSVSDSTSISVVEVCTADKVEYQATKFSAPVEANRTPELHGIVRPVHRPKLSTNYETIVLQVASIMSELPSPPEKPALADATGLGTPVVQLMRSNGLKPIGITTTSGNNASLVGRDQGAPKALIVGELRLAFHQKRLKVAQFPGRENLAEELSQFLAKLSASGRATFEAAGDGHDDDVLSLALAWFAAKNRPQPARYVRMNWIKR